MQELIKLLIKNKVANHHEIERYMRQFLRSKNNKEMPSKKQLLKVYHNLLKKHKIKRNINLEQLLIKRAIRTMSGVAIVTVLTKPYPCPGNCIYCPDEIRMPKSYLSDEPAAARALMLQFDPYEQVKQRIIALKNNGHPTDKIELIVKGGSWNAYPLIYQYWFILRCFEACNEKMKNKKLKMKNCKRMNIDTCKSTLNLQQRKNETAKHRIIGLTLETRPDMINNKTIQIMRELGCTRMEIGVQTIDNKILQTIKRGHNSQSVIEATRLLKNYGFKVDYHLMPQLPDSTPTKDLKMMKEIFSNPNYRPDMIKIYPCTAIKGTELYNWVKQRKYKPYSDKKLIETIIKLKTSLPYYVRISRLIRDIPAHHIMAGNSMTNLRQVIQTEMKKQNLKCNCLRCREVGHNDPKILPPTKTQTKMFIDKYQASDGIEYFLSFEDKNRTVVYAFCRLRITGSVIPAKAEIHNQDVTNLDSCLHRNDNIIFPAFIRELHTYGEQLSIGQNKKTASQHKGLGKKLIAEAEKICQKNKLDKLAVISGVGVRGYYRKWGYRLEKGYMVKKLKRL